MEHRKTDKEALVSLYKNAHIALQSISDIIKEVSDENMKRELSDQYDGYEKVIHGTSVALTDSAVIDSMKRSTVEPQAQQMPVIIK